MAKANKDGAVKDAVKKSGLYGLAVVARRLLGTAMVPLYTRFMTRTDYGIMDLLDVSFYLVTLLFGLRRAESLLYLYKKAPDEEGRRQAVSTSMVGSLVMGIVLAGAGWLVATPMSQFVLGSGQYRNLVILSFVTCLFIFPIESGMAFIRAEGRVDAYTRLSLYRLVSAAGLNVALLVFTPMRVEAFLWSNLITAGAQGIYLTWYCLRYSGIHFTWLNFRRDAAYGFPLAIHGLSMMVIHFGDRYFLRTSVSLGDIGIYSLAYKMGMIVSYIQTSFDMYWRVQVFDTLEKPDGKMFYVRAGTYLITLMGTGALMIALYAKPGVRIFAGKEFADAAAYVPLLALAYVIRAAGDQLRVILRVMNQNWREVRVTMISSIFCFGAYAVLIPRFGVTGAVWATLLTFLVMMVLSYFEAQAIQHFKFEYSRFGKLIGSAAAAIAVNEGIGAQGMAAQLGAATLSATVYAGLMMLMGFLAADERVYLRAKWVQLRTRYSPSRLG